MRRCINDPSKTCSSNGDCVEPEFCQGTSPNRRCAYDWRGSLGDTARPVEPYLPADDLASLTCSTASDCVPAGVSLCRYPLFKVKAKHTVPNTGDIVSAWDINWDPDERHDLLVDFGGYFGSLTDANSLKSKFTDCLNNYWSVNPTGEWNGSYTGGCAWLEAPLPTP
jgi:hypothetical protein